MDATEREDVRVELAVRSLGPGGRHAQQDDVIDRLRTLSEAGGLAEFDVSVWGKRIGLDDAGSETGPGREILSTVETFEEWADENDYSIGTFFQTKRVRSPIAREDFRALELPTMTLAEYRGDDLHWVSPCLDPTTDTVYTVHDRVAAIEGEVSAVETSPATARPPMVQEE